MKVSQLRGARIASNLKQSMNSKKEKELNDVIPLEDSDPYKDSDNDKDENYAPPSKKLKTDVVSDQIKKIARS